MDNLIIVPTSQWKPWFRRAIAQSDTEKQHLIKANKKQKLFFNGNRKEQRNGYILQ
jgi:hypothetical protein